jgi:hypothetical protein
MYHEENANLFWILLILLSILTCAPSMPDVSPVFPKKKV